MMVNSLYTNNIVSLCLLMGIIQACGFNVTPAPYGVVALKQGKIRISVKAYEVIFLRYTPKYVRRTVLIRLEKKARALIRMLSNTNPDEAQLYYARLHDLRMWPPSKKNLTNYVPGVGILSKTLFGITTVDNVNTIRTKVNELVSSRNVGQTIVDDLLVCVNDTATEHRLVRTEVDNLIQSVNSVKNGLNVDRSLAYVSESSSHAKLKLLLENIVSYLNVYKSQEVFYDNLFQFNRDMFVIGDLTETLISRRVLATLRRDIGFGLSVKYLYRNLEVKIIKVDEDYLGFWISIPIIDGQSFTSWKVITVPVYDLTTDTYYQIVPELEHLAVGL
uniref:ORF45 n=1 Tax=Malaco herpesvirus 4 TaxID=3031800 RepID=A0AA48SIM0_9VIRU|nr:TPA_asm: ORF45 [Malaco herpesvirus 4]